MNQDYENYTCPYCRWSHSHSWDKVREEEDIIDSKYCGQDITGTYWLETKRKFKVKICSKCNRYLKIRSYIISTLLSCSCGSLFIFFIGVVIEWIFPSPTVDEIFMYIGVAGMAFGFILFLFWILWKILGPARAHVDFDRAKRCNALKPLNLDLPYLDLFLDLFNKDNSPNSKE